jgi:hypothetical protein
MNTKLRNKEQIHKALTLLGKAKFTNARNLQDVARRNRRGFPTQLKKLGLLVSRELPSGQTIYGLSSIAAETIGVKKFDIHNVSTSRVEHSLIVQAEVIDILDIVENYEFEPQGVGCDYRPDATVIFMNGGTENFEAEINQKNLHNGEMDRFFLKILGADTTVLFVDPVLLERYLNHARRYIRDGIPSWTKLNGQWFKLGELLRFTHDEWLRVKFKMSMSSQVFSLGDLINDPN